MVLPCTGSVARIARRAGEASRGAGEVRRQARLPRLSDDAREGGPRRRQRVHAELPARRLRDPRGATGCHLFCEKPIALSMKEAAAMAAPLKRNRVRMMTGFTHRFLAGNEKAKELLDAGAIGRPFMIRIRFAHEGPQPGWAMSDWFYNPRKAGGGACLDMGIHAYDLCEFYLGRVASVQANIRTIIEDPGGRQRGAGVRVRLRRARLRRGRVDVEARLHRRRDLRHRGHAARRLQPRLGVGRGELARA